MATIMAAARGAERPELLRASDAEIRAALMHADPMVLRGLLYQLTGDPDLRDLPLKRVQVGRIQVPSPATDEDLELVRRRAADFLIGYRDAGAGPISFGPRDRLPESLALIVGEPIPARALDLMIEETALDPWARSLTWSQAPDPERLAQFSVLVIGAGMGGLNAAVQLKRAGIRHHVVEKNDNVGGTWWENRYPGARVDTPSRSYFNLFGVDFPYPYAYGTHVENQRYYDWVADEFGLRGNITFNTEVRSLTWDEAAQMWDVVADGPEGERRWRVNAVITGVGFLNRPNLPEIEGMEGFRGQSWHTARWPDDGEWRGKRIAVIGTGCTGYQLIPEIAPEAAHVTVFQRTPQWLLPVPGYLAPAPEGLLWLDRNLPFHTNFMRFKTFYGAGPDFTKIFDIDPDFDDPHTCSPANKAARERTIEFLKSKLDEPALIETMTPAHPPWSARPVAVDPENCVLDSLLRDNVTLVTAGISRIVEDGIEDGEGNRHEADVIVYATGFRASDFLYPMTITGRGGVTIEQLWKDDGARAYLGCMMPGFPNLWTLYGPNTNGGLPVAQFHEVTMRYALQCMERLILDRKQAIEVTEDAYWRYNRQVDELNATKIWADPRAHNYWWTKHGRTSSQIPFTGYEVRELLLHPDLSDLELR
jgi:4-hydroxyacetophenone monooxygenase